LGADFGAGAATAGAAATDADGVAEGGEAGAAEATGAAATGGRESTATVFTSSGAGAGGVSGSGAATTTDAAWRGSVARRQRRIDVIMSVTTAADATTTAVLRMTARRPVYTVDTSAILRVIGRIVAGSGERRGTVLPSSTGVGSGETTAGSGGGIGVGVGAGRAGEYARMLTGRESRREGGGRGPVIPSSSSSIDAVPGDGVGTSGGTAGLASSDAGGLPLMCGGGSPKPGSVSAGLRGLLGERALGD
jgi:hypothetical protein